MNLKHLRSAFTCVLMAAPLVATPLVVHAQAKAPPPPPSAAPAPAPAPAPPPVTVTPETRAAIKDLLDAMNTREALTQAFGQIAQTLAPRMGEAMNRQIEVYPNLSPEQKLKVRQGMNAPFEAAVKESAGIITNPKLVDDTIEKMIPIYASHFTMTEIKELTAFYRSALGNKMLTTLPQVSAESLQAGVQIFSPRVNAIMESTVRKQADAVIAAGPDSAPAAAKAPAKAPVKK
jgi:hypothetical protein